MELVEYGTLREWMRARFRHPGWRHGPTLTPWHACSTLSIRGWTSRHEVLRCSNNVSFGSWPGMTRIALLADDPAVGLARLTLRPNVWYDGAVALLDDLYVVPSRRSRGYGAALLEAPEGVARARGAELMEINVHGEDVGGLHGMTPSVTSIWSSCRCCAGSPADARRSRCQRFPLPSLPGHETPEDGVGKVAVGPDRLAALELGRDLFLGAPGERRVDVEDNAHL